MKCGGRFIHWINSTVVLFPIFKDLNSAYKPVGIHELLLTGVTQSVVRHGLK